MKKLTIAVSALAAAAALGFAPVASATEADYVAALAAAGVGPAAGVSDQEMAASGYAVCQQIASGVAEATIVGSIPSPANGITPQQAQQIYDAANNHLCAG